MTKTKSMHTPGPFLTFVFDGSELQSPEIVANQDAVNDLVAKCERATAGNCDIVSIPLASAVAAPELLEALRDGLRALRWSFGECGMSNVEIDDAESVKRMSAAIAKAEGK